MKRKAATKKMQLAVKRRVITRKVQIYGMTKEDLQYILDALAKRESEAAAECDSIKTVSA